MRSAIGLLAVVMFPTVLFAEKTAPPLPPPPAADVLMREVRYDGQLTDNEARFAVDFNLEVPAKGGTALTLLEGDVAVFAPKLPAGLRLDRAGNQYRLLADKPGPYKFRLELVAKIARTEPWNQVSFTGPAAAIASVAAQAGGAGMDLQLLSGTLQESTVKDGVTRVRGFLGSERVVSLRWQSRMTEVVRQALLTCETTATAQITPAVVKYTTQLRYEILQGTVPRLTVALPAAQALTKLQGDQIRDWQTKTEGDRQLLTVEFIKPVEKTYSLALFSEQAVEGGAGTGAVPVSPPQPQAVERESGSVTLTAEDVVVESGGRVHPG
jgi:hypothetical protein